MPLRKDATGKRWVEMEVLVPGTPDQVWRALATGDGNAAWFVKAQIEPRAGGALVFDFGDGASSSGQVTTWEPPRRFDYVERDWTPGAPPVATQITITSRSADTCVVRMVHSLLASSDEWDEHLEGFESGWPGFFAVLGVYLASFAGSSAASFMIMVPANADPLSTWQRLGDSLGLAGTNVGERRSSAAGPEPWSGIVERIYQDVHQRYVLLRLDSPSNGVALLGTYAGCATSHAAAAADTANVSVCRYFYGDAAGARATESETRWRAWLADTFGGGEGTAEA